MDDRVISPKTEPGLSSDYSGIPASPLIKSPDFLYCPIGAQRSNSYSRQLKWLASVVSAHVFIKRELE
jgi:hypothetical protein